MTQWMVEITSADSELLAFLAKSQQGNLYTFIKEKDRYYLSSSDFNTLTTTQEVEIRTDGLLSTLNGIIKHEFLINGHLARTSEVVCIDEHGHRITKTTRDIATRVRIRADFFEVDKTQSLSFVKRQLIANNDSMVREAMRYYANEANWFNLHKVYEVIAIDSTNNSFNLDLLAEDRARKFLYSANNANASGDDARHPLAKFPKPSPKLNMSLGDAQKYIDELLTQWLETK